MTSLLQDGADGGAGGIRFQNEWNGEVWKRENRSLGHCAFEGLESYLGFLRPKEIILLKQSS